MRIEGLEMDGTNISNAETIRVIYVDTLVHDSSTDIRVEHMIIHDFTNSTTEESDASRVRGIEADDGNVRIGNNIIYDLDNLSTNGSSSTRAIYTQTGGTPDNIYVYNNTIYNIGHSASHTGSTTGIYHQTVSGTMTVTNNIVLDVTNTGAGAELCYFGTLTQTTNVSSDTTATGTAGDSKTDYDTYFVDVDGSGTEDLHLKDSSLVLFGFDGTDLDSDANYPITDDIDGDTRDGTSPDLGADEASGSVVYYSVGTDTSNLESGSGNVSITDGVATFTVAQADNVGLGDEVVAGGNTYYISSRTSSTVYNVKTRTGAVPSDLGSSAVTSISRTFNTLSDAESNSSSTSYVGNSDLTSAGADVQLNWVLYNDGIFDGADGSGAALTIDGYTTDETHYIRMFTPTESDEVGTSQRHTGVEGTGVVIQPTNSSPSAIFSILQTNEDFTRFEGIEIDGSGVTNGEEVFGVLFASALTDASDSYVDDMIIHDLTNSTTDETDESLVIGIYVVDGSALVKNTIIYDLNNVSTHASSTANGVFLGSGSETVYVYNTTGYNLSTINASSFMYRVSDSATTTLNIKNSYCGKFSSAGQCYYNAGSGTLNQTTNVSSDTSADGTAGDSKTDYDAYFVNATSATGETDLHLRGPAGFLWGLDGSDLSSDAVLPVTDDIDGASRDADTPDIGADEWAAGRKSVFYSVGTDTTNLETGSGTVTISNGEATFSVAQADNVGVGDEVIAGGTSYHIAARSSSTVYAVTSVTGTKPADIGATSVTSIKREFNTLSDAETNSSDSSHLNNADLTPAGADTVLNWALYNDGAFTGNGLDFGGYTTASGNYVRLFVPSDTSEVGTSQRHSGVEGSGALIQFDGTPSGSRWMNINGIDYFRMEGIEIDFSNYTGGDGLNIIGVDTALADSATDLRFEDLIIHDYTVSTTSASAEDLRGIMIREGNYKIRNTIIYDLINNDTNTGTDTFAIDVWDVADNGFIHNVTVYNIQGSGPSGTNVNAVNIATGTTEVTNVYAGKILANGAGTAEVFRGSMTQATNVSSDTSADGTAGDSKTDYETYFVNSQSSDTDLHLRGPADFLWGLDGTDLDNDTSFAVVKDIDGGDRDADTPDIGADEWAAGRKSLYYSVGTDTSNLETGSGTVTVDNGTATFSVAQADTIGVGDEVIAGGNTYHIASRSSSTVYAVTTVTGTKPSDLSATSVTSIKREFNTLSDAETNSTDSSHLNNADITADGANVALNWSLYDDGDFDGVDGSGGALYLDGYTTGAGNYIPYICAIPEL